MHAVRESCYLTFAWKHRLISKKKVIEKYGPNLRIYEKGKLVTELFYPKSLKSELKFLDRSYKGYITNLNDNIRYVIYNNPKQHKVLNCVFCRNDSSL